jgi:hypothetical protein
MPWWLTGRSIPAAAVVAALLLAAVALVVQASSGPSCGDPDDNVDAGLLSLGENGYRAILEEDPGTDCAEKGLTRLSRFTPPDSTVGERVGRIPAVCAGRAVLGEIARG